jgi:nitrogen regulatory protein PII
MKTVKRVEIIVGKKESEKVFSLMAKLGIKAYTRLKNVEGSGDKFDRDGNYPSDVFTNNLILIACTQEEFDKLKEPLRLLLKENSGVCMVSDVEWLLH